MNPQHAARHGALLTVPERLCLFVDTSVEMGGLEFCRQRPRRFTRLDAVKTALCGMVRCKAQLTAGGDAAAAHEFCVSTIDDKGVIHVVLEPTRSVDATCAALACRRAPR